MAAGEFHEAFWVVAGTAAPVLLVATAVTIEQWNRKATVWPARPTPAWAVGLRGLATLIGLAAAVSFGASAQVLFFSIRALMNEADDGMSATGILLTVAVTALAVQLIFSQIHSIIEGVAGRDWSREPTRPDVPE